MNGAYTERFWEGLAEEKFFIHHCEECYEHFFPPSPICPLCHSQAVDWQEAQGRGELHSFTQQYVAVEGFNTPLVLGLVTLKEGPRLMTPIDATYDELAIGQSVILQSREYSGGYDRGEFAEYPYFAAVPVELE